MKNINARIPEEYKLVLQELKQIGFPLDFEQGLENSRNTIEQFAKLDADRTPELDDVKRTKYEVSYPDNAHKVALYEYRPIEVKEALPLLYWMHGGGYISGTSKYNNSLLRHFARTFNCVVISVEYRLAPENPFPIPLEDCYLGLKWAYEHCDGLNINPSKITIGGQSAGGGLSAALAQLARDRKEIPIHYQFLFYPMLDDRNISLVSETLEDTPIWSRSDNYIGWKYYLGHIPGTDQTKPYASPIRTKNLENLPAALIMTGDLDLFIHENLEYAQKLTQAGVPIEVRVYPGGIHAFEVFGPHTDLAKQFITDRDHIMQAVFRK